MTAGEEMPVTLARLEGKIDTLAAGVSHTAEALRQAITFGDQQNAQQVTFVDGEVRRAHVRVDVLEISTTTRFEAIEKRARDNFRLIVTVAIAGGGTVIALLNLVMR